MPAIPYAGAPTHGASSPFAYSNPQPFEQIIKIHLYLICLLELIEFLRSANVSGCTLPPNGDPAAGAAGAAPGFYPSLGTKATPGQGTGCPQRPLLPLAAGGGMYGMYRCTWSPKPASMGCALNTPQTPWDSHGGGFGGDMRMRDPIASHSREHQHPAWWCSPYR